MPTFEHIQSSFGAGELSPRLFGHLGDELFPLYKKGLSFDENWEITPHGSSRLRGGLQHVSVLTSGSRVISFRASGSDYDLVLGDRIVSLYKEDGTPVTLPTSNWIRDGRFIKEDVYWQVNAASGAGVVFNVQGSPTTNRDAAINNCQMWQQMYLLPGSYTLTYAHSGGPAGMVVAIAQTPSVGGAIASLTDNGSASQTLTFTIPSLGVYWLVFDTTGPNATVTVQNVVVAANFSVPATPSPWAAADASSVQEVYDSATQTIFLSHVNGLMVLRLVATGMNAGSWEWGPMPVTGLDRISDVDWQRGFFPAAVGYFQGRLYLASTPDEPNTIFASRPGRPFNFLVTDVISGTPTETAGTAIRAPISMLGAIEWIRARQLLLFGADEGEFSITAQSGSVSAIDFQVKQESGYGSSALQAEDLGDQVMYVSRDFRRVRALNFYFQENAWVSSDVTWIAEHITGDLVKEAHWAPDPNRTIVLVMQSGKVVCCTYDRAQQTVAWWRLATSGTVLSASVTNGPSGSILKLIVQRANGLNLEKLPMSEAGRVYVDAAVTKAVPGTLVVTGLSHLNGQAVRIILDGALEEDQVVVSGQVTLARAGTSVTIGLGYTATGKTLPPEGGNPRGTAQRAKRRWAKVGMRLNDSALPLINGERAPDRSPATSTDAATGRVTGDVIFSPPSDWGRGELTFVQDLPLRTEILAFYGPVSVSEV